MARVFTAADIEDSETLQELTKIREKFNLGFNPVKKGKMHITLQFFKNINTKEINKIEKALKNVEVDSFKLKISEVGAFPSKNHIRVIWAGAQGKEIFKLYNQSKVHQINDDNTHDFVPHITLLRVNKISPSKKKKTINNLQEYKHYFFGEVKVNKVKIIESQLKGNKSTYKTLKSINL